jgi:hypothetical protein
MLWVMRVDDGVAMFDDDPSRRIPVAYGKRFQHPSVTCPIWKLDARAQTKSATAAGLSRISQRSKVSLIFNTHGSNNNLKFWVYLVATLECLSNIYISTSRTMAFGPRIMLSRAPLIYCAS